MKVILFARARELVGQDSIDVPIPANATVADLRRLLEKEHPVLAGLLSRCALAVNEEFADDSNPLPANAEVALLPPVSGG